MARVRIERQEKILTAQRAATPLVQLTTRQILVGARRLVPKGTHVSGSGRRRPGKQLGQSLDASVHVGVLQVRGRVVARKRYAMTAHQGSRQHIIRAKGKLLKFRWERGDFLLRARGRRGAGGFFYFERVNHPGNKRPVRYLVTPLHQFGRLNGFRVSSTGVLRSRLP